MQSNSNNDIKAKTINSIAQKSYREEERHDIYKKEIGG